MSDWTPDIDQLQTFDNQEWLKVEGMYCGRLMAYVSRRVGDIQAREDIVQETFLGSVRGIPNFDRIFTFEQYLFGICRNRTIDYLRRRKSIGMGEPADSSESLPGMEDLAREECTPSGIVHQHDMEVQGQELLLHGLRDWVQETWQLGEFKRLMVIEALFSAGWRNRDTWSRFELRDETAVAGIKFRALKRLRELVIRRDPSGEMIPALADVAQDGTSHLDFNVKGAWQIGRVACPARYWLARYLATNLAEGPRSFIEFHLEEMKCQWCQANLDDLKRAEEADLAPFLERMQQSTMQFLRSRSFRRKDSNP